VVRELENEPNEHDESSKPSEPNDSNVKVYADRRSRLMVVFYTIPFLLLGVALLILMEPKQISRESEPGAGPVGVVVEVTFATPGPAFNTITKDAIIVPTTDANIMPQQAGWLRKISVRQGQPIKAGQAIAVLEPADDYVARADVAMQSAAADVREDRISVSNARDNVRENTTAVAAAKKGIEDAKAMLNSARSGEQAVRTRIQTADQKLKDQTAVVERLQALVNQGAASTNELRQAQNAQNDAVTLLDQANIALDAAKNQVVAAAEGVDHAQDVLDRSKDDLKSAQRALVMAQRKMVVDQAVMGRFRSQMQIAKRRLKPVPVVTPVDGTVENLILTTGALITPATPIAQIKRGGISFAEFDATVDECTLIKQGMACSIKTEDQPHSKQMTGRVASVVPPPVGGGKMSQVFLEIKDSAKALKPGSGAIVKITTGRVNALLVPKSCVMPSSKGPAVWLVTNNICRARQVKVAGEEKDMIAIVDGLKSGDMVVVRTSKQLRDGMVVQTRPASATSLDEPAPGL